MDQKLAVQVLLKQEEERNKQINKMRDSIHKLCFIKKSNDESMIIITIMIIVTKEPG